MTHAQLSMQEFLKVFRRRKRYFFLSVTLVSAICIVGAFLLPRKYQSSSTILVQKDEILNPLVSYDMAVAMASEDMLKTFNEIIYSSSTIQTLIDTLQLGGVGPLSEDDRQELMKKVRKDIETDRPGSSTFRISVYDTDPRRAQRAVSIVADIFIRTILQAENKRNEMAVDFFERKLDELRVRFEKSQQEMLTDLRIHIQEMPGDRTLFSGNLSESERSIREADDKTTLYRHVLTLLRQHPDPMKSEDGKEAVYEIERLDVPYAAQLRTLLTTYEDFARKYTVQYPNLRKTIERINGLLTLMGSTLEKEIDRINTQRLEAERRRAEAISDLQRSTISKHVDEDKETSYDIYRKLYNDMKIKLEQARTTRDLGRQQKDRFVIIDPPLVPTDPAKPNKALIIAGGCGSSVIIGLIAVAIAELLDSTMRSKRDFAVYNKPIIAYIPDGSAVR